MTRNLNLFVILFWFISTFIFSEAEEFNITIGVDRNFTLEEGEQSVAVTITDLNSILRTGRCELSCVINQAIMNASTCEAIATQTTVTKAHLKSFNVTQSHTGQWICTLSEDYPYYIRTMIAIPNFAVTVKKPKKPTTTKLTDTSIFIGSGVGVLVLLIIVGQTICILYFKAKARKAEMIRNLTPKNSMDKRDTTDVRYVKKATGSSETIRESGIYEALETVRAIVPPPPPPIATLPVTPRPLHMSRSISHSNLALRPDAGTRTTPRPQPKNAPNPRTFNTVDRCLSLERIRNRPPQPLPTSEEIYEDFPLATPELPKANRLNTSQGKSSLAAPKKKKLFGRSQPTPDPKRPLGSTRPEPNSPATSGKPLIVLPGASSPGATHLLPGQNLPGLRDRPPIVSKPGQRQPTGFMPVMGGMPVLPSMISGAHLKPVKHITKPPVGETKLTPGDTSNMAPANLASKPRPLPPNKPKLPMPVPVPIKPEPQSMLTSKPKLPLPVHIETETATSEPSLYQQTYYETSSDEEFDCYDVLPEYRIYGNAPPKKIP